MRAEDRRGALRRLLATGAALLALYLLLLTGQRALEGHRARQEVDSVAQDIAQLRVKNASLQEELSIVKRDIEVERIARTQLGLVRPGDQAVVILRPAPPGKEPAQSTSQPAEAEPPWRSWLRLLIDFE